MHPFSRSVAECIRAKRLLPSPDSLHSSNPTPASSVKTFTACLNAALRVCFPEFVLDDLVSQIWFACSCASRNVCVAKPRARESPKTLGRAVLLESSPGETFLFTGNVSKVVQVSGQGLNRTLGLEELDQPLTGEVDGFAGYTRDWGDVDQSHGGRLE